MIKLIMDVSINDLTPEQLECLDWKSVTKTDLEDVKPEIISANVDKLSPNTFRAACKMGKITFDVMTEDEWIDFIHGHIRYSDEIEQFFSSVQLPYSIIHKLLHNSNRSSASLRNAIYSTQKSIPMGEILKNTSTGHLSTVLRGVNKNSALIDYMFTEEGLEILKSKGSLGNLQYLKSTEAEKLGLRVKNHTISPDILRRAGACSDGINYCRRTLKELELEKIKWDDMIEILRNNHKIASRPAIYNYTSWIIQSSRSISREDHDD